MIMNTGRLFILGLLACVCTQLNAQAVQVKETPEVTRIMTRFVASNKASTTVNGWRVQLLATTDRQRMESVQQSFQYRYPNIPVDWVHNKPYYKLRAGAFTNKMDAQRLRYILERDYDGLYLVFDDNINVRELLRTY